MIRGFAASEIKMKRPKMNILILMEIDTASSIKNTCDSLSTWWMNLGSKWMNSVSNYMNLGNYIQAWRNWKISFWRLVEWTHSETPTLWLSNVNSKIVYMVSNLNTTVSAFNTLDNFILAAFVTLPIALITALTPWRGASLTKHPVTPTFKKKVPYLHEPKCFSFVCGRAFDTMYWYPISNS